MGRIMLPSQIYPHVNLLISKTQEYAASYRKREFTDVINVWIVRWEQYSGSSRCTHCNHRGPYLP